MDEDPISEINNNFNNSQPNYLEERVTDVSNSQQLTSSPPSTSSQPSTSSRTPLLQVQPVGSPRTPVQMIQENMNKTSKGCCCNPKLLYNIQSLLLEINAKVGKCNCHIFKEEVNNNILAESQQDFPISSRENFKEFEKFLSIVSNYTALVNMFSFHNYFLSMHKYLSFSFSNFRFSYSPNLGASIYMSL
ncbi:unnamed protein product [Ceutorhynchus assimilis]|uniref:Uncharacterized protein n=1 Tax=Ceutorhynchus assimilis TaxID=467358 RepID=A0A9N9QLJ2_9CUCU|nr:unnamed protein product [Ceutorhynchus assimilis]